MEVMVDNEISVKGLTDARINDMIFHIMEESGFSQKKVMQNLFVRATEDGEIYSMWEYMQFE